MLFERSSGMLRGWFATHPPLLERIRELEPSFQLRDLPAAVRPLAQAAFPNAVEHGSAAGLASAAPSPQSHGASPLERAGEIAAPAGRALRAALPEELSHATRSREGSLLVVVALALSSDEPTRRKQLALVEQQLGAGRAELCRRLLAELGRASPELRLPLLDLALPTLRQRPRAELTYLVGLTARIQELEGAPRLFDFVLLRVMKKYLHDAPGAEPAPRPKHAFDARSAVRVLLATVAAYGNEQALAARAAYETGLACVGWAREAAEPTFEPPTALRDLERLDSALFALASLRPREKERVLRGVLATIRADTVTAVPERELFRVIASALDCPLPPDVAV
jgi:hypothetical protein